MKVEGSELVFMEAELKAKELVEKFKPFVYCYSGSGMLTNTMDDGVILDFAKRCAVESVDEILNHINEISNIQYHFGKSIAYWKDVQDEIKKLTL